MVYFNFYSIIHQLQGKSQEELEKISNKYNNNYKLFDDSKLTEKYKILLINNNKKTDNPENKYNGNFRNEELAKNLKKKL